MSTPPRPTRNASHAAWPFLVAAGCLLPLGAAADSARDPFGTATLTPARPGTHGLLGSGAPCANEMPGRPINLAEVIDLALCRNPLTRETWANARARAADVGLARSAYLPGISASAAADLSQTRQGGQTANSDQQRAAVSLSWLLADFGARDAGLESARRLLIAASATQDSRLQSLFFVTLQAYYEVHARHAAVLATQDSERAAKESLRAAATRYAVGAGTPADRLQAQTAYTQAVLDRVRAEGDLRTAHGKLANAMGYDAHQPVVLSAIDPPVPLVQQPEDIGALIDAATRQRPDLIAAQAELLAAQADIDAARATYRPRLSLAASAGVQDSDFGTPARSGSIELTLNVPLFSGHEEIYRVRAAQARADASEARRDVLRLQVSLDVWRSYQALQTASEAIRTSLAVRENAEVAERVALGRYRAGVGNLIDLLNAQAAHARARQQQVQAQLDWNLARAALAQAMGRLDGAMLTTIGDPQPRTSAAPSADRGSAQ